MDVWRSPISCEEIIFVRRCFPRFFLLWSLSSLATSLWFFGNRKDILNSFEFCSSGCTLVTRIHHELHFELFGRISEGVLGTTIEKKGLFELMEGGTIALLNIEHADPILQDHIVTTIEKKEFRRLRASTPNAVADFRLVITAAEPRAVPRKLIVLFNSRMVEIPPLRERPEDIEPIVVALCQEYFSATGIRRTFQKRVIHHFLRYSWPGNVNELRIYIGELLDNASGRQITPHDLHGRFFADENETFPLFPAFERKLRQQERDYFEKALRRWNFNKDLTAREISISPPTLRRRIAALGISTSKHFG